MNETKLAELRRKYGGASGSQIFDPEFRAVAEGQFSAGRGRSKPYSGVQTFLGLPYMPNAASSPDFDGLDVAVVGVPMDLGVTNRSGSRFGPRAVRDIERIGPYEHVLHRQPAALCKAADIGDVPFRSRFSLEQSHEDIQAFYKPLVQAGVIPLSVGGDHSISYSILRAVGAERPVGMVHFDAHCDTSGDYEGAKFHHGGPFRHAVLEGVLDPARCVQIGIRGSSEYLWEFSKDSGMTVIHGEEVPHLGPKAIIETVRRVVGEGPVYVTFDVDCLDPAFAPGTGTPEVGGLTTREALELLRGLDGLNIVGGDVVEVAPQYDTTTNTAQAGAQVLFELFSLVAGRFPAARRDHAPTT
ncbi:agmatinase [Acetobacter estunensis]|uniref:agmatinase n=1 Tax=Acetobacter estunensis TaxID=104097 RepID=UPI001C2D0B78|nr:agmatinase [Acetobacter estunensis]MBV1835819.1 agmatinase [Acetobacter estunensis]MBV1835920.1 agmatinase [Acetobacter estunensis]